jgi:hypothetical protein
MPPQKVDDALYLKNRSLLALRNAKKHIAIGFRGKGNYITGRLALVDFFEEDSDFGVEQVADNEDKADLHRNMLWCIHVHPKRRVLGYEKPERFYFVTGDLEWWAPLTKKKPVDAKPVLPR